ncbi:MAG: 2Fe-2S iron-sulfur cluster-binding protein [Sulfurifustaceae bacterium]
MQQDPAARAIEVRIGEVSLLADAGQRLIDLCDAHITPLQFGCRAGSCGTCLVRVVEGTANVSGITDNEKILLPELSDDPSARLGCQLRLFGPVRLVPVPPFAV